MAWENILKLEAKMEFKNISELTNYLNIISSHDSPLTNLLKQIKHNIDINKPPAKLTKEINIKLQNLDTINLKELQNNLEKLAHYVNTIGKNPDPGHASFVAMIKQLRNASTENPITTLKTFANHQPPYLGAYLLAIANNTCQVLFDTTYNYINNVWTRTVIPKYKATLENKYPLFKESKDDIAVEDFNNFFGPNGTMDAFFNRYIEPFVNIDKTNWTWKNVGDQETDFSPIFLEVFLRAALIQKMFYPSKTPQPKLEFTLTPIDITPHTQNFTLHIDGQKTLFSSENKKAKTITWPGPQPGLVTLSFVDKEGKYFTTSEFGPWAWFRVLDKANVTSNNNIQHFELTFDLNGNAAKYTLSTTESVNPFIPEIVNNFRCQEQQESN